MEETIIADVGARGLADLLRNGIVKFVHLASLTMRGTLPYNFLPQGFLSNLACSDLADDVRIAA
jgi:hypothetical protein